MKVSWPQTVSHYVGFLFALGLGVVLVLMGTGVLAESTVAAAFTDTGWMILLILIGVGMLWIALHFLLVLAEDRLNKVVCSRVGEWGRIDVSPVAVRELIGGILRDEIGLDRFRVFLRRRENGVAIRVRTALTPDQRVTDIGERIQRELTRHVVDRAGVEVHEVTVFVRSIRAREADATMSDDGVDEDDG